MGPQKVSTAPVRFGNVFKLTTARRMILAGMFGIILVEIYAAVMQKEFQNTDNRVGKGFAILGIYLFVVVYCKISQSGISMHARSRADSQSHRLTLL